MYIHIGFAIVVMQKISFLPAKFPLSVEMGQKFVEQLFTFPVMIFHSIHLRFFCPKWLTKCIQTKEQGLHIIRNWECIPCKQSKSMFTVTVLQLKMGSDSAVLTSVGSFLHHCGARAREYEICLIWSHIVLVTEICFSLLCGLLEMRRKTKAVSQFRGFVLWNPYT